MIHLQVRRLLEDRDMSQIQLAKETGIAPATISFICRDIGTTINKEHLEKIAKALHVKDFNELFSWD